MGPMEHLVNVEASKIEITFTMTYTFKILFDLRCARGVNLHYDYGINL